MTSRSQVTFSRGMCLYCQKPGSGSLPHRPRMGWSANLDLGYSRGSPSLSSILTAFSFFGSSFKDFR